VLKWLYRILSPRRRSDVASKIDTPTKRRKLSARREPYWHKLGKGQYLGFRKAADGGSWIARFRTEEGSQKYHRLAAEEDLDFEEASKEARKWFEVMVKAPPEYDGKYTVKQCVDDYVAHLKVENGEKSSTAVRQSLEKHLVSKLGNVEVSRLTTHQLKRWRNGLVKTGDAETVRRSRDTANRVLSIAKAALNLAFREGPAGSDTAWRRVQAFKDVGESRKLFLSSEQVDLLIAHAEGKFKNLLIAARLTGARYGELASAKVQDLDPFNGTLHLDGKTGPRHCYLSDEALVFFKRLTKERLPTAYLLVRDDGEPWGKSHQHRPMKEAVRAARLPAETVFYSLRHYHISKALLAGIPAQVVAENCGTSLKMLEKHYAKFMGHDRRRMMNEVAL
jgi:integrase